ncbi:hypothetical protein [uncultured Sphingomonas sp.]|uniref:hypothetical protein n=1 Tax=uncultured Sphingomonas sp. TaxID=158754 RepID=UPI00262008D5|nr:hypothetical protein [uncultured Sphingomonas sp.]
MQAAIRSELGDHCFHTLCDRVIAHLESFRRNVDANIAYVAVSRARKHAAIYTDNATASLATSRAATAPKVGAIDEMLTRKRAAITIPMPVRAIGMATGSG